MYFFLKDVHLVKLKIEVSNILKWDDMWKHLVQFTYPFNK